MRGAACADSTSAGKAPSQEDGSPGESPLGQPRDVRGDLGTKIEDVRSIASSIPVNWCELHFGDEIS